MYDAFIKADKAFNHKVFGGHWNQTVSRNAGTKIGRTIGIDTDAGTHLFHGVLAVGGLLAAVGIARSLSR